MPRIIAARHVFPPHKLSQQDAKELIGQVFVGNIPELERLLEVFDNSRIEKRQLIMPSDWYLRPHTAVERNQIFLNQGFALLHQAAANCLSDSDCSAQEINHVIYVNSTGHATPTLDARLINELGLSPDTTRLPIWGLGCAAGAVALSRAFEYCRAYPQAKVMIGALECCSLTFMSNDLTKKNLIGTSLFADGASAVLVTGDEVGLTGPEIIATHSHLFPETSRIMGWDFVDEGMQLVLSPRLPALIKQELPALIETFLEPYNLNPATIRHYLTHPGGAKVIEAFRDALALSSEALELTEKLLFNHGNISSVSVLVLLEQWLADKRSRNPGYGLISAFGPGFSSEMLLVKVN